MPLFMLMCFLLHFTQPTITGLYSILEMNTAVLLYRECFTSCNIYMHMYALILHADVSRPHKKRKGWSHKFHVQNRNIYRKSNTDTIIHNVYHTLDPKLNFSVTVWIL